MKLHDSTRRLISLLIFFLLGPMLTLGILVGIGLRKLSSNAERFQYEISVQTGLQWKIRELEYRRPGAIRLKGVEIVDEITSKSIFEAVEMDIEYYDGKNREKVFSSEIESGRGESKKGVFLDGLFSGTGRPDGFWLITIPNSVVKLDHYESDGISAGVVWSAFSKLLARFPLLSETPVQISLENVGIFSEYSRRKTGKAKFEPFRFVRGNLYRTREGVRSDWSFLMPEVSELETQRISIVRRDSNGSVEIGLRTGKIPVPCESAAVFCPMFGHFGPRSRFSGDFSVEYRNVDSRTIRLENVVFQNIDIAPIVSVYTSFPVSGTVADFQIRKATFGTEMFFADGAFLIENGEIDMTLFSRFVQQFDLTVEPGELLESPRASVPFEKCALQFLMQHDGVVFRPADTWEDVFLYRGGDGFRTENILVRFPGTPVRPVSYHAILSVLAPDTAPVVPLTPSLKKLYSVIPVEGESRLKSRPAASPESPGRDMLATAPGVSEIMAETIKSPDRFLADEPPAVPAGVHPVVANPVTAPTPSSHLLFVDPRTKNNRSKSTETE